MAVAPDYCYTQVAFYFIYYKNYLHGYVSCIICVLGSVANIISIIVLTRKKMVSPTNIVLTGLVVADLALLLNYIPLACYEFLSHTPSYEWWWFKLWLKNLSTLYRTIAIWMTIMLTIWRYLAVVHPLEFRKWCTVKTTYIGMVAGYILCPLLCVPLFISGTVGRVALSANKTITAESPIYSYEIRYIDKEILNVTFPNEIQHCIFSVVLKLMPSIVLTILSIRLVYALLKVKELGQKLTPSLNRRNANSNQMRLDREEQNNTTRMLLALLFLFLLTEVPDGILSLLMTTSRTKIYAKCFYKYYRISDPLILLKMIDAAINFPVFYFMGCQFRTTCQALFNCNTYSAPRDLLSKDTICTSKGLEDSNNCLELRQMSNQCTTSSLLDPKELMQPSPTDDHSGNPSYSSS